MEESGTMNCAVVTACVIIETEKRFFGGEDAQNFYC